MMTLQDIMQEAQNLSAENRRELIKMLVDTLAVEETKPSPKKHSILELRGLGKELWRSVNTTDYLNEIRDEWDRHE